MPSELPSEQHPDLGEVLERVARSMAAGEVRVRYTDEVELHAPIVGPSAPRRELPSEAEALLRARFDPGRP